MAALVFTGSVACANGSGDDRNAPDRSVESQADTSRSPRLVKLGDFRSPVEIKAAPGFPRLMFVVEQRGRIMVLRRGKKLKKPFLNITRRVQSGGEQGLLSVGFPPDYRRTKRFYVYYTDHTGDIRVVEYRRRTAVRARPNSARPIITIRHRENSNHNGGQLQFLGNHLYFGTGDGGGGGDPDGNAQNRDSLLGKMIRIDPRRQGSRPYSVPASNPFVGGAGRDEIFSIGLRNPYRWSFDRYGKGRTRIAIGDVGQDRAEEVNVVNLARARGGNFGWNRFEGFSVFTSPIDGTIKPSLTLGHGEGNCSVIGGVVARDRKKLPALRGQYLFADFCGGKVLAFKARTGRIRNARDTGLRIDSVSSFGRGLSGAVYATSLSGPVYRIRQ